MLERSFAMNTSPVLSSLGLEKRKFRISVHHTKVHGVSAPLTELRESYQSTGDLFGSIVGRVAESLG